VKPLLSLDNNEARLRVRSLYKAWWRFIPTMVDRYELPMNTEACRKQLRKKFEANSGIKDIRVIDMLVVKVKSCFQWETAMLGDFNKCNFTKY
jgi:NADH dehydrogenase (ubiquinone) 1 alpha subcomplex subunit 6